MKKQRQTFLGPFIVVTLIFAGAVLAVGDPDTGAAWADGETLPITRANLTAHLSLPIVDKPYRDLRVAMQTKHQNRMMDQYLNFQRIAEDTNIYPKYETLDRGKWPEYEPSIFAGRKNLPDLVEVNSPALRWSYAQAGMILPLDELIFKYAPDLKNLLDMRPTERKLATYPDGNIYGIPRLNDNRYSIHAFDVDKAHLKALNMEVPQSYDELLKLAKAIRTGDPDGDGQVKQSVFRCYDGPTFINHLSIFYGFMRDPWILIDGKMKFSAATDKYKDLITEVKRWYDEGLINQLMFDDAAAFKASGEGDKYTLIYEQAIMPEEYVMLPYFDDVYGNPISPWWSACYHPDRAWTITKDADSPEIAIKWLDYIAAHYDGNYIWTWGIPEEDWTWEDGVMYGTWGNPAPNDEWAANQKAIYDKRKSTGGQSYTDQRRAGAQWVDGSSYLATKLEWNVKNLAEVTPIARLQWAFPMFSEEEQDYADEWQTPAHYIDEMLARFVTGKEPLANWDVYVSQLKKFGLDAWEKAHQMAYERMQDF